MAEEKPALPLHERILALGLAGFFVFMTIMNMMLDDGTITDQKGEPHFPKSSLIEITIEGKVAKPGTYLVEKGTAVRSLIEQAEPLEGANLKRIKLDSKLTRRRKIIIR